MNKLSFSQLHDEKTFYRAFLSDLDRCQKELLIESPYITTGRMNGFRSVFNKMLKKGVKIYIFTRDPLEHEAQMALQAETEISHFERIGIQTFLCSGNHHRKLAIIDRKILWEGSLNILSQAYSREMMRRIENSELVVETFEFLQFGKFI